MILRARIVSVAITGAVLTTPFSAQSEYTTPDDLTPLSTWRDGYSAEETLRFRRAYGNDTLAEGADDGAYAISHLSEVLPTAIVHRDGPVSMLQSAPMPGIAEVVATTDLGPMSLRQMLDDPRSRMRVIAVEHKGKLVFEEYLGSGHGTIISGARR